MLLSKNCVLAGSFELVFALNLPVDLKGCAHSEHNFQSADVLAMSWRIDGHKLIAHCHRVHVVFLSQKVQREDIFLCGLERITEACEGYLDQTNQIVPVWTDLIPDFNHECEFFKTFNYIRSHKDWELGPVVEIRLCCSPRDRAHKFLKGWECLVRNE